MLNLSCSKSNYSWSEMGSCQGRACLIVILSLLWVAPLLVVLRLHLISL
uniref:Uncharacterized protein n=1 Tax=Anguilla anguilla TaxID=7936 RepID=A0A0E9QE43_ANGAN